jgi:hypothetical protein
MCGGKRKRKRVRSFPAPLRPCKSGAPHHSRRKAISMEHLSPQHLRDAIEFLQKVFVGSADEQRLVETINALHRELKRKQHGKRKQD